MSSKQAKSQTDFSVVIFAFIIGAGALACSHGHDGVSTGGLPDAADLDL